MELARALAEAPGAVLALGAVEEDEPDGRLLGHAQRLLEQLERRLVRPVEILEDDAERLLLGEPVEQLREDLDRLVLDALAVQLADLLRLVGLEREPQEVGEERVGVVGLLPEDLGELRLQLETHARLGRRRADAQPVAQEVADGGVGEALRVRDRPALDEADQVGVLGADLVHEPRLADAGLADHRDDHAAALAEAVHRALEDGQLEVASHERAGGHRPLGLAHAANAERGDGDALAAELLLAELLELEAAFGRACGLGGDRNLAGRRDLLETRGDVDGVTERVHPLGDVGAVVGRDDDRTGVHAHAHGEVDLVGVAHLLGVPGDRALDRERGQHGALGVVLVADRGAENGEDLVSDALHDGAVVAADLGGHDPQHFVHQELRALGPEALADARRVDDVGDENRDDSLLTCGDCCHWRSVPGRTPVPGALYPPA